MQFFAKERGVTIALENTPGELGAPETLQQFIKETHLHDLKLCFDIGHAHIEDGVQASFEAMRDRIVTTHIHDNHGDKDEHLLPYNGNIDWDAALTALAGAPVPLPLVVELKEQQATGAPHPRSNSRCVRQARKTFRRRHARRFGGGVNSRGLTEATL